MDNGNLGINLVYTYAGNPTNVSTQAFNPPKGSTVIDTVTPAVWQKTSLNDNSGYSGVAGSTSGAITPTTVAATGAVTSSSPTLSGYVTGAGGTVTQGTSLTTGVTLSKPTGQIVGFVTNTTAATLSYSFTVTNTLVTATDVISVNVGAYGGTTGLPIANVTTVGAGSYVVTITNISTTAALNGAVTVNTVILNGVIS